MSAFGSMGRCLYANCSVRLPADWASGVDGRGGNQPRCAHLQDLFKRAFAYNDQLAVCPAMLCTVF